MSPSRAEIEHRAVALIGPDERRRAECMNGVKLALSMLDRQYRPLRRHHRRKSKPAQRAADRLHKALKDLQRAHRDWNLSDELYAIVPDGLPRRLIEQFNAANAVQKKAGKKRVNIKTRMKEAAATEAHHLLRQFNRKISITKDSTFCKLAALLYGDPQANLQYNCREVLNSEDQ